MTRRIVDPETLARNAGQYRAQMTHRELLSATVELATVLHWRCYFTWRSDHSPAGYPDLTAVHPGQRRVLWIEFKVGRDKLSAAQQEWLDDLRAAGCEAYVLRVEDWHSGAIEALLRARPA